MKFRFSVLENKAGEPLAIDFEIPDEQLQQLSTEWQRFLVLSKAVEKVCEVIDFMYQVEHIEDDINGT